MLLLVRTKNRNKTFGAICRKDGEVEKLLYVIGSLTFNNFLLKFIARHGLASRVLNYCGRLMINEM